MRILINALSKPIECAPPCTLRIPRGLLSLSLFVCGNALCAFALGRDIYSPLFTTHPPIESTATGAHLYTLISLGWHPPTGMRAPNHSARDNYTSLVAVVVASAPTENCLSVCMLRNVRMYARGTNGYMYIHLHMYGCRHTRVASGLRTCAPLRRAIIIGGT